MQNSREVSDSDEIPSDSNCIRRKFALEYYCFRTWRRTLEGLGIEFIAEGYSYGTSFHCIEVMG
jgi:hypothetical protein